MSYKLMIMKIKLKNFINKLRGIRDLDNDGKIESVREEMQGIFQQFATMRDSVDSANLQLGDIVEDELKKQVDEQQSLERLIMETNKKLEASANRVAKAESEIEANKRVRAEVSKFIAE